MQSIYCCYSAGCFARFHRLISLLILTPWIVVVNGDLGVASLETGLVCSVTVFKTSMLAVCGTGLGAVLVLSAGAGKVSVLSIFRLSLTSTLPVVCKFSGLPSIDYSIFCTSKLRMFCSFIRSTRSSPLCIETST